MFATLDEGRMTELDKQFRKDISEMITAYIGDGLTEGAIIETLKDEIAQVSDDAFTVSRRTR